MGFSLVWICGYSVRGVTVVLFQAPSTPRPILRNWPQVLLPQPRTRVHHRRQMLNFLRNLLFSSNRHLQVRFLPLVHHTGLNPHLLLVLFDQALRWNRCLLIQDPLDHPFILQLDQILLSLLKVKIQRFWDFCLGLLRSRYNWYLNRWAIESLHGLPDWSNGGSASNAYFLQQSSLILLFSFSPTKLTFLAELLCHQPMIRHSILHIFMGRTKRVHSIRRLFHISDLPRFDGMKNFLMPLIRAKIP